MKNTMKLMGLAMGLAALLVAACGSVQKAPPLTQRELSLVESSNQFGFNLFSQAIAKSDGGNLFISPLSVSMALGMAYNGSAGTTQDAMKATLGLSGMTDDQIDQGYRTLIDYLTLLDPRVTVEIANSIWSRQGLDILKTFIDVNKMFFDAVVSVLDFNNPGAADTINAWVNDKTHGKISSIVDKPIDPSLVMFLINAVYFKGDWTYQFDKNNTAAAAFHAKDQDKTVQMMHLHGKQLRYFATADVQAVDLPYGDGLFSMAIFLPAAGKSIDDLVGGLTPDNWTDWMARLHEAEGDIFLPRFELEFKTSLNEVLMALGMEVAFNPDEADFSRIVAAGGLFISEVKHKTYLKVDEVGTEAAAVTSIGVGTTSVPETFTFRADVPFLIVLHDTNSKALLFMGKIVDPPSK